MEKIAFLGLGAMGSRMVPNLLKAGYQVTVWNRSSGSTLALESAGATVALTPRAAVEDASIVISMVRDDQASSDIWLDDAVGAIAGLRRGCIAIESSTVSPEWIQRLSTVVGSAGGVLLDAPVAGSLPQAAAAQLIFMVGGDSSTFASALPVLSSMGLAVHHVGPVGQGSLLKLVVNSLLGVQVAVMGELLGLLSNAGMDASRCVDILASLPVASPAASGFLKLMLARDYAPRFTVDLLAKDFGYAIDTASRLRSEVPITRAAYELFLEANAKGLGSQNISAIARVFQAT